MSTPLQPVHRTLTRCLVCGSSEIRSDEVVDRGLVLLHECPRCDHRWTASASAISVLSFRHRVAEVPAAA